jgi:hypothetical protein
MKGFRHAPSARIRGLSLRVRIAAFWAPAGYGQERAAGIVGRVADERGEVLPGVTAGQGVSCSNAKIIDGVNRMGRLSLQPEPPMYRFHGGR